MGKLTWANWQYREGIEFRERTVQQALLLGFTAEEYEEIFAWSKSHHGPARKRWRFSFEGIRRGGYASIYSAALEYLRLSNFPEEKIGRVNDGSEGSEGEIQYP